MKRKIIPRQKYTTYAAFPLVSGDVRAYEIELDLGEDIKEAEFKVTAIRPDGKIIEDIGVVADGFARYTMAGSMYAVAGQLTVRLSVVHDSSVLTDREIIFEVLEGTAANTSAETVVPINDSVILRLSALESKLFQKVDKVSGKVLSSNDFTDEYKGRLDGLDERVDARIEKVSEAVDNTSDSLDEHIKNKENPHGVTAPQVGAYTKSETNSLLNKKADKSDISNVYRFKGSVETTDALPDVYTVKAIGDATDEDGNVVGTYNEETGELDFDYSFTIPAGAIKNIYIPCTPVVLKPGHYLPLTERLGDIDVKSDVWPLVYCIGSEKGYTDIHSYTSILFELREEVQIKYITVMFDNSWFSEPVEAGIIGTGSVETVAVKVICDENSWDSWEYSAPQNGDVYNVLDTDTNYAWTGKNWDSLGGEHKDVEARAHIEELRGVDAFLSESCNDLYSKTNNLETQMGDIETALDSIITIQNELIGGEEV